MSGETSPPSQLTRARLRHPSGPRSRPRLSSRHSSSSSLPSLHHRLSQESLVESVRPSGLFSQLDTIAQSPADLRDGGQGVFTLSPESSPGLRSNTSSPPLLSARLLPPKGSVQFAEVSDDRSRTAPLSASLDPIKSVTAPLRIRRPGSPSLPMSPPPDTVGSPPPSKSRPKPTRLDTQVHLPVVVSPSKPISPGIKHWQHVRQHVLAPSPISENARNSLVKPVPKKSGLVDRAKGRFGFRNAAESVMGYPDRRVSMMGQPEIAGMTAMEQEEAARERRAFSRDIKTCLDACSTEETSRRIARLAQQAADGVGTSASATFGSSTPNQRVAFDPEFSAFAPLLLELHRYLPAARAKRIWSRTCPHHAAVLAELQVAFSSDTASTAGERQQILEIFGVLVKNWAADSEEEDLQRWSWLCRALAVGDRQLRTRGFALLSSFLHADPGLPRLGEPPNSALAFLALANALLRLLYALQTDPTSLPEHVQIVEGYLDDLVSGNIIDVEEETLQAILCEGDREGHGDLPRELIWISILQLIGDDERIALWLLHPGFSLLHNHTPGPILPGTPPLVLELRRIAALSLLNSATRIIRRAELDLLRRLWSVVQTHVINDLNTLPDTDNILFTALSRLVLGMELMQHGGSHQNPTREAHNPFQVAYASDGDPQSSFTGHRPLLENYARGDASEQRFKTILSAAQMTVESGDANRVSRMMRFFLDSPSLSGLGRQLVPTFLNRFAMEPLAVSSAPDVISAIVYLSTQHPQLFYKPLFSLSASSQPNNVAKHLRVVRYLMNMVEPELFWFRSDPQMVAIVLAGEVKPRLPDPSGDSSTSSADIRLGRYVCLVELIRSLAGVVRQEKKESARRKFAEVIELRFAGMLEMEESVAVLPGWYRALACQLLLQLRKLSRSVKRPSWLRLILRWYLEPSYAAEEQNVTAAALASIYRSAGITAGSHTSTPMAASPSTASVPTRNRTAASVPPVRSVDEDPLSTVKTADAIPRLLVGLQACLSSDDWAMLLPVLWTHLGWPSSVLQTAFLFTRCVQVIPDEVRAVMQADLTSRELAKQTSAIRKISLLHGIRYQISSQDVIAERRGPIFHFPNPPLDYVATEIGSPNWVPPQDIQDAALKRFGPALPLELRQRLLELGWPEDKDAEGKEQQERFPLSILPSLQLQQTSEDIQELASSPHKPLGNGASSNIVAESVTPKRRRAVFPPLFFTLMSDLTQTASPDTSLIATFLSAEVIHLLEKDDPILLSRLLGGDISIDFRQGLSTINKLLGASTPAVAYALLNALTGFLKTALRSPKPFQQYAVALSTIVRLIPNVSEFSLRNIRKSKAEHVLLPASIHEEEGGFKLHQPWQDGRYDVQTAQILLLIEALKANPREVYLVKKMVANLQIQASIQHVSFSRAWCLLIVQLFSTVNRNYNDRAELRHLLTNVVGILAMHGASHLFIATQAMRVLTLCAIRFRRVFASIGFGAFMTAIFDTYTQGDAATKDCIEYCLRACYRVHEDVFVYQACLAMAANQTSHQAAYALLSCLSSGNSPLSGVASGIRGLLDEEELGMLKAARSSSEEIAAGMQLTSSAREDANPRSLVIADKLFPRENIVRLIITLFAISPASARAAHLLDLLAGFVPLMQDEKSSFLLTEAVRALGKLVSRARAEEVALPGLHATEDIGPPDWIRTKRAYIRLVECYASNGGQVDQIAIRYTLTFIVDVLRDDPLTIAPVAARVVHDITKFQLTGPNVLNFLEDFVPMFRLCINLVDFSGFLECLTNLIRTSEYELDKYVADLVVNVYLPSILTALIEAAENLTLFGHALRMGTVELLSAALYMKGVDALQHVETCRPNANFLAGIILPLCLMIDCPTSVAREDIHHAVWIRLLRYVIPSGTRLGRLRPKSAFRPIQSTDAKAVERAISLQIVKVAVLRANKVIDQVKGLWSYIAEYLIKELAHGDGRFFAASSPSAKDVMLVDLLMWSAFELLCLHRSPLMIHVRKRIQLALQTVGRDADRSQASSPRLSASSASPRIPSGHLRMGSNPHLVSHLRSPSSPGGHLRSPSGQVPLPMEAAHGRSLSRDRSPSPDPDPSHVRSRSRNMLSPYIPGHNRVPSAGTAAESRRPTFTDLSARRASRPGVSPVLGGPGFHYRFPSSAPARSIDILEKGGGAIIHLLAAPNQVLAAPSGQGTSVSPLLRRMPSEQGNGTNAQLAAVPDVRITSSELQRQTVRALKTCLVIFGHDAELDESEPPIKPWSTAEALHHIEQQMRLLIEEEFRSMFVPGNASLAADTKEEAQSLLHGYDVDKALVDFDAKSESLQISEGTDDYQLLPTFQFSTAS